MQYTESDQRCGTERVWLARLGMRPVLMMRVSLVPGTEGRGLEEDMMSTDFTRFLRALRPKL